jgi:predicted DsbA family dithiol-disulfide isomerase
VYQNLPHSQCYLGQKRLERAISLYHKVLPGASADTFKITWHPFYLDPTLPKEGVDSEERLRKKYGAERVARIHEVLSKLGEAEGIHYKWSGKVGNTRNAHRLIQFAKTTSNAAENKLVTELFRSRFEEGNDLTSEAVLVEAAGLAGLDKAKAQSWLQAGRGGKEVDDEVDEAYAEGIQGVPHFVINDRYEIDGAQDVQAFLEIFAKIKQAKPGEGIMVTDDDDAGRC